MTKKLTEFECLREAGKLYTGVLNLSKAIKFLKFENGWDVEIITDNKCIISKDLCNRLNVTVHQMQFMKDLQESGEVNMMMCRDIIQRRLIVDRIEAKHIHSVYLHNYTQLYTPEQMFT